MISDFLKSSSFTRNHLGIGSSSCRYASHSVMSSKPPVPKPLKQIPKTREGYGIHWNQHAGGLQGWTDWRMKKNVRDRKIVVDWGLQQTLVKAMKRQVILPREIQVSESESDYIKNCVVHYPVLFN